jgi:steroid delta-isomerase
VTTGFRILPRIRAVDTGLIARLLAAAFMFLPLAAVAQTQSAPTNSAPGSSEKQIRAALDSWRQDFNAGRAERVCDLFARDAIASYQGQPERRYDAICGLIKTALADTTRRLAYTVDIKEVLVFGAVATVRLVWTLQIAPKDGTPSYRVEEQAMDLFQRQADGKWRIIRSLAYPSEP